MKKLLALSLAGLFLFTGCFGKDSRPEKERFIDATKEVTCLVFGSADILDPALEEQTKEIFKGYGFDVEDEEKMLEIAQKYDSDPDVQAAVEAALEECAGDLMDAFSDLSGEEETPAVEEETTEGEEVTTEETESTDGASEVDVTIGEDGTTEVKVEESAQ